MDRRPSGIDPAKANDSDRPPVAEAAATADTLSEPDWDRILPPIDESNPEWQDYERRMIQEALDDPRPSIPAEEVFASLRALHEARLKREA